LRSLRVAPVWGVPAPAHPAPSPCSGSSRGSGFRWAARGALLHRFLPPVGRRKEPPRGSGSLLCPIRPPGGLVVCGQRRSALLAARPGSAAVGGPVRAAAATPSPLGGPRLALGCQATSGASGAGAPDTPAAERGTPRRVRKGTFSGQAGASVGAPQNLSRPRPTGCFASLDRTCRAPRVRDRLAGKRPGALLWADGYGAPVGRGDPSEGLTSPQGLGRHVPPSRHAP